MKAIDFLIEKKVICSRAEGRRIILMGGIKINDKFIGLDEHQHPDELEIEVKEGDVVMVGRKLIQTNV